VRSGHAGRGLTEPAFVVRSLANPLKANRGSPVARANLRDSADECVAQTVQVTRLTTLPKRENERGQDGSMGRKGPRRTACPPGQPQVGEVIV
jgi:hypothetical protein